MMPTIKKLIEVALPLEAINAESAREKSIRHGHPSTLHLWWARRPLATARAVIWSSLVDDPSSHPEQFPTEEAQQQERERLFDILTRLVKWENSNDEGILAEAKAEIMKSTNNNPPALLDPFAGGGAIPLEAQRLGLEAHAHDLNPVAVMINKAMIEIPPKFAGRSPVNPEAQRQGAANHGWKGAAGLAEDVRYYGEWMKQEACKRIGHLYPKAKLEDGSEATVIAWIWARTVKCPNPACGCEMPLVKSFMLSKKKGKEAYIQPTCAGSAFTYKVVNGKPSADEGTVSRAGAKCLACGTSVAFDYIRQEAREHRMQSVLTAVVAEGKYGRLYLTANSEHRNAAHVSRPDDAPSGILSGKARVNVSLYGFNETSDLFTPRQLTALTTFSSLVSEAQQKAEADAVAVGVFNDHIALSEGGSGARAYGEAVGVYLAFVVDKMADYHSSICSWHSSKELIRNTFGRQAIPMVWDFAEANPFSDSAGCCDNMLEWVTKATLLFPATIQGSAKQHDAQSDNGLRNIAVSTDPPYYDNIGYADLSDYFYVWMRQALKGTYPKLFRTMLVPKAEELVATPYRFDGSVEKARDFFEDGMFNTCCRLHDYSRDDIPVTIYYAFKQSETDTEDTTSSTGWETMLSAIIRAGFSITGTWPMRTEMANRSIASGTNALASSIVLVCRKRDETTGSATRREFINALHREMRPALEKLQSANIAPVDLAQSAIGPGIGVFSRYKSVLEADGKPMSVRAALQIINQELDAFYNEQEGELDRESRFCVELFSQYAFNNIKFGDADILARAKNTSVQALAEHGVLMAAKGQVRLKTRDELPESVDTHESCTWLLTQQLARAMEVGGVKACAAIVLNIFGSNAEEAKALAYRLYTICERKNWAQEGYAYNNLVVAWPDIQSAAAQMQAEIPVQIKMELL
jgi:Adenine-specific DNA methylase containing a Zn-ribbon